MRKFVLPLVALVAMTFCVKLVRAEDAAKDHKITGVLIDKKCAAKFTDKDDPEKAAGEHKASCAVGCAKHGSPLVLLSGKEELTLDKHGQELAMEYLGKDDAKSRVTITGEKSGDELKVESITAAE